MKIAIFSDCYLDLTGGIVSSINAQKQALEAHGHTVSIFTTAYPHPPEVRQKLAKENIFIVPSCRFLLRGLTPVSRRPKIIETWLKQSHPELKTYDIFYIHYEAGCSIAGLRLAKEFNIPSAQVMHGREDMGVTTIVPKGFRTIVGKSLNWLHSRFLPHPIHIKPDSNLADTSAKAAMWTLMVNHANAADLVLTPSAHFRQKLLHYGVKKPIKVMPNGYPDDKFPAKVKTISYNPDQPLRLIWHSRVQGEKRIMPFLAALNILQSNLTRSPIIKSSQSNHSNNSSATRHNIPAPSFTMDIYGGGTELRKAKRYARHHHLPVIFHGDTPFPKVSQAISSAHLDIMASYNYDTFGMTLIEAEAHGVPVFFCDPDMKEIVPRGSFILSKSQTPEDMATALQDIFTHPDKIHQMSEIMIKHRNEVLISKRIKKLEEYFSSMHVTPTGKPAGPAQDHAIMIV